MNAGTQIKVNGTKLTITRNNGRGVIEVAGARGAKHALCQNVHSGRWTLVTNSGASKPVRSLEVL